MEGRPIIPYSLWLILAAISALATAGGIARLLSDKDKVDNSHVLTFIVGGIICILVALTSTSLDFICTGGSFCVNGVQAYHELWWAIWPFFAMSMLDFGMMFIAATKLIDINKTLQLPD